MNELNAKYRTTVFIIAGQIITIIALTIIAWLGVVNFEMTTSESTFTVLWVAIIFIAVVSFILRRSFLNWEKLTDVFLLKGEKGLFGQLQLNSIILSAFAEAIAVIGFIITAMTGDKYQMLRAAAIALIVCLINFPRRKVWENIAGNLEKLDAQNLK